MLIRTGATAKCRVAHRQTYLSITHSVVLFSDWLLFRAAIAATQPGNHFRECAAVSCESDSRYMEAQASFHAVHASMKRSVWALSFYNLNDMVQLAQLTVTPLEGFLKLFSSAIAGDKHFGIGLSLNRKCFFTY